MDHMQSTLLHVPPLPRPVTLPPLPRTGALIHKSKLHCACACGRQVLTKGAQVIFAACVHGECRESTKTKECRGRKGFYFERLSVRMEAWGGGLSVSRGKTENGCLLAAGVT